MAHALQNRYSELVDLKLRSTLVKKDGIIFNTRYEGDPKAGIVKIPVRDTEVEAQAYDRAKGVEGTTSSTSYVDLIVDKDYAVNEIIDGYEAAAVPDGIAAERLDSAGYSLALRIELDATKVLEDSATAIEDTTALTKTSVYDKLVDARTQLSENKIPDDGRRWLLVSPKVYALILKSPEFTKASDLGDKVVQSGAVGKIAGFLAFEDTTLSATTEFIAGHPDWCSRVTEWKVPVKIQDLSQSGKFIGASAVQGRNVYGHKVTKGKAVLIKKNG